MNQIDSLLHQPVRTRIMVYLSSHGETDYTTLKRTLELTDGHMSTHMKKLVESNCITVKKFFEDNRPKTTYKLSATGQKRLLSYLRSLEEIVTGKSV